MKKFRRVISTAMAMAIVMAMTACGDGDLVGNNPCEKMFFFMVNNLKDYCKNNQECGFCEDFLQEPYVSEIDFRGLPVAEPGDEDEGIQCVKESLEFAQTCLDNRDVCADFIRLGLQFQCRLEAEEREPNFPEFPLPPNPPEFPAPPNPPEFPAPPNPQEFSAPPDSPASL